METDENETPEDNVENTNEDNETTEENDTSEDNVENTSVENTSEENTSEENTSEENTSEENTSEENTSEENTSEENTSEENTSEEIVENTSVENTSEENETTEDIEHTNIVSVVVADTVVDTVCGKVKKQRPSRKKTETDKFTGSCEHCLKVFKNIKIYEKHINEQLCYKDNEITYCNICLITYKSHNEYKNHLFSVEHINKIGFDTIEKIDKSNTTTNTNNTTTVNTLDPYLTTNDVKKLSTNNLGDSFTFVYEKGNTQTITLKPHKTIPITNTNTNTNTMANTMANTMSNTIDNTMSTTTVKSSDCNNTSVGNTQIPIPSIRQTKLINFLEKQMIQSSIDDSGHNFYKMLDNKLQLEDYKSLQKIVKFLNINEDYKLNYLKTIDIFINYLVKEKTLGHNFYKDKDISQLVINLTS